MDSWDNGADIAERCARHTLVVANTGFSLVRAETALGGGGRDKLVCLGEHIRDRPFANCFSMCCQPTIQMY